MTKNRKSSPKIYLVDIKWFLNNNKYGQLRIYRNCMIEPNR